MAKLPAKTLPNHSQRETLALKIIRYLQQNDLFENINLYVNGKRYSAEKDEKTEITAKTRYGEYFIEENSSDPCSIVDANPENPPIILITFEGALYDFINYGSRVDHFTNIDNIVKDYNLYFEQEYSWSMGAYPIF